MKVKYVGKRPREVVPFNGERSFVAQPGETVSVSNAVGASLLDQPRWFVEVKDKPEVKDTKTEKES
jgi:hypothetical protein